MMFCQIVLTRHTPFVSRDFSELREALSEDGDRAGLHAKEAACFDFGQSETLRKLQEREFA